MFFQQPKEETAGPRPFLTTGAGCGVREEDPDGAGQTPPAVRATGRVKNAFMNGSCLPVTHQNRAALFRRSSETNLRTRKGVNAEALNSPFKYFVVCCGF